MIDLTSLAKVQDSLVADIMSAKESKVPVNAGFLTLFSKQDVKLIKALFGGAGESLHSILQLIDLSHPGINDLVDEKNTHRTSLSQILKLGKYAIEESLEHPLDLLSKSSSRFLKKQVKLFDRRYHLYNGNVDTKILRLISDRQLMEKERRKSKVRDIDLQVVSKPNFDIDAYRHDFAIFHRGAEAHKSEIEKAKKRAIRYKEMKCMFLYREIISTINKFKDNFENDYYGFRKISLSNAAIILSRMACGSIQFKRSLRLGKKKTQLVGEPDQGIYYPLLLPIHECKDLPSDIMTLVEYLDRYPGINHKPLFDEFFLVLPYFEKYDGYRYINNNDRMLPVLVGMVDGQAYFICYVIYR